MKVSFVLAMGLFAALPAGATAQVYTGPGAYQQVGPFTYGPNGSSQQQVGSFTYVNPGRGQPSVSYQQVGPMTYGSNGYSQQQVGNFGYGNDGTTTQKVGDFTYIRKRDGSTVTCQEIGSQTYCR